MKFGIWFEPEMVNEDSQLFKTHPDWVLKTPGRYISYGRNQMVLDFSKEEIEKAMAETGIPVNVRGEALTLKEFADLANAFNKLR